MKIVPVTDPLEKSQICEKVLRSLPEWFGIESAILDYIQDVRLLETWAVMDPEPVGFISLKNHYSKTSEIYVMGLMKSHHGRGIGAEMIRVAENAIAKRGLQFLTVKTLSESRPNKEYDQTRNFYLRQGFVPLEEFKSLWNEANPCLFLAKTIPQSG
jgi:ribosomal protein S18 acetylase RimI-like enzyme